MEQVLFAGYDDDLHVTGTEYNSLWGGGTWAGEFGRAGLVSTPGKIKKLRVELVSAPTAGKSFAFTLMVNGAPSALTCTISDAATSNEDSVNEVAVSAGDYVSLRCVPTGNPTVGYARWSTVFDGNNAAESLLLGVGGLGAGGISYNPVSAGRPSSSAVENNVRSVCPTGGAIKNLYVRLAADPGTAPDAYRLTLRVNGASSTLTCTITADDVLGNDTVNEVTVAAGDVLTLMQEPLNGPAVSPDMEWGMTFVADTDGESLILAGSSDDLHATTTEYNHVQNSIRTRTWTATEADRYQLGQECTLRDLYILLSAAPGAGNSRTFTLRNGGATLLTVTIAEAATTGNDTVNSEAVADGDEVTLEHVPVSSPVGADAYWGMVSYIEPAAGGVPSSLPKVAMTQM